MPLTQEPVKANRTALRVVCLAAALGAAVVGFGWLMMGVPWEPDLGTGLVPPGGPPPAVVQLPPYQPEVRNAAYMTPPAPPQDSPQLSRQAHQGVAAHPTASQAHASGTLPNTTLSSSQASKANHSTTDRSDGFAVLPSYSTGAGEFPSIPSAEHLSWATYQLDTPPTASEPAKPVAELSNPLAALPFSSVSEMLFNSAQEVLPNPAATQTLPLAGPKEGKIEVENGVDGRLSISLSDAPLRDIVGILARSQGLNVLSSEDLDIRISGHFSDITFDEAMDSIFALTDATWTLNKNVILVSRLGSKTAVAPQSQGRLVRVFQLNFVAAADVEKVVTTLLSPAGKIAINEVSSDDSHKTREQVIIEDLPQYLERIAAYVREIDQPPLQVLIEAHILQVDLSDQNSHGVDFAKLGQAAGLPIVVTTPGFNGSITDLSTFTTDSYGVAMLDGSKFSGLIQALQKTNDAKTLASPKVMALNGQVASVQIGEKLGYFVTTTTQTTALQSVEFLETGVVLKVTPRITDDGRIMMTVQPEVSDGSVDDLGLPSERTTEVSTTLMLTDGMGMIVGGLIKETDIETQQKIPILGSLWGIGKLFSSKQVTRERNEIIIALVPHIVRDPSCAGGTPDDFYRVSTPLLDYRLESIERPMESQLPDATENPRRINFRGMMHGITHPNFEKPRSTNYFFPLTSP